MIHEVVSHKCPNCSANIEFDIFTQNFTCRFCGSAFSKEEIEKLYPTDEIIKQMEKEAEPTEQQIHETDVFRETNQLFSCPSCGAEIISDNYDTTSAQCHYCNSNVSFSGRLSGRYKPDKIIPFKKTKEDAIEGFKQWCGKKKFLPKCFRSEKTLEEIKGIYVPFWIADCCVNGELVALCKKSSSHRSGNTITTTTKEYTAVRRGSIIYRGVPADGSSRANDQLMENIEPFNYDELVDFSMAYLSGHNAEKYDVDKDAVFPRISGRVCSAASSEFRKTIRGYSTVIPQKSNFQITHINWNYALIPMWFLSYKYKDKNYYYAMNGQTGKFGGNLPVDKLKVALAGIAVGLAPFLFFGLVILGGLLL